MVTTADWAISLGISTAPTPPAAADGDDLYPLTARQVATRAVILQGIVAVAAEVEPQRIIEWYQDQRIWEHVTPHERAFLANPSGAHRDQLNRFAWQAEAEWALLWTIGKVEALGLPTHRCDSRRLVDEIIPALGSEIGSFLSSAVLRPKGVLLAEDDRHYNLWCYLHSAASNGQPQPEDLIYGVIWQRVRAFEWLDGITPWDEVRADA
jgi:hypothetical protein